MLLAIVFQLIVPILLIAVVALARQPNRPLWALSALAYASVLAFMSISYLWGTLSFYLRPLLLLLFAIAAIIGYRRIRPPEAAPNRAQIAFAIGINLLLLVLMTGMSVRAGIGYATPDGAIELASPLRNGRFAVVHGGTSTLINAHAKIHPQDFAIDLVQLNRFGRRASLLSDPQDLAGYEIYGTPLYSPCNGTIVAAVDQFEDLVPGEMDPEHLAGNHVLIACDGFEVLLAHLKKGTLAVRVGDVVTVGTELGQVGNTGNTSEPHLHLHAERGGEPGVILDGTAVPFTIGGRFLVRNAILDN